MRAPHHSLTLAYHSQHIMFSDQPLEETILTQNLRRQSCSLTRCAVAEVSAYDESSSYYSTEALAPRATHPMLKGSYRRSCGLGIRPDAFHG